MAPKTYEMKTIIYSLLLLSILVSCRREPKNETQKDSSLIIGNQLSVGIDDILIFPVGTGYNTTLNEGDVYKNLGFIENTSTFRDRWASKEYINERENDFDIRNILFYNLMSHESAQLTSDTVHILSFAIHREFDKPLIFYRTVKKDFNDDKKYNSSDPVMLYASNINGDSLVQITPTDESFSDYSYYPKTKVIIIKTIIDSDGNKEFSMKDETNFLEMNVTKPAFGREIFSKELKASLRKQINIK